MFECPDECYGRVEGCWVIPDVFTVLCGCRPYPGSHPWSFYNVVVFMAAQPSKDNRLGGCPQNFYAGRHHSKRFVQGAPHMSISVLSEAVYALCIYRGLMVNNKQYDSHEGRHHKFLECFIVDRFPPCLRGVGVKVLSGKEDTTLLSMADCRVKQATVSTATRYGIKPRIQGCPRGSVRMGGQRIRY